jgi:PAS domain S-box-containing protein
LNESDRQLDELTQFIKSLPVAALLADLDGVTLDSNQEALSLFGKAAEPGEQRLASHAWFQRLSRAAESGAETQKIKISRRTRPGKSRCKITAITVYGAGRASGVLLIAVRSGELRADLQYRRLLDDLLEPVAVHVNKKIVYANTEFAHLFGVASADELIGRSIVDFVHPDYRAVVAQRMAMVKAGYTADTIEEKVVRSDGVVLDVEVRATRVHFDGRNGTQVIVRDITGRKQMEAGLEESQQRYRVLTESVRDHAIVAVDCDHRVSSWNESAAAITGYEAEDVVGQSIGKLFSIDDDTPPDFLQEMFSAASAQGKTESELWARHRNGNDYSAGIVVTAMRDPDGDVVGYSVVLHDLSRQREIESRLRKSEDQLRQAQKMDAIGRLAAGIAHDFKNLITAIHGHAQFLLEDLPHTSDLRNDVVEIKRAADRAAELTRQLLTFARKQEIEPRHLDVNDVIRNLEKMLRRLIRADIALKTHLSPGLTGVLADQSQIEQVIMNLVVNARDAIPGEGSISIVTSSLDLDERYISGGLDLEPGKYVMVGVTDTGVGMDAETQKHIFEPFFTTKREGEGTGLGLATVYGIVRRTGGHISVYSEPGKGTTVKVFLPAGSAPAVKVEKKPETKRSRTNGQHTETVLLVEDDDAIRSLATRILRSRGYPVLAAGNGQEAIAAAKAHAGKIDLLLTDLMMPGLNGEDLAVEIRQMCPGIAVMFMSGLSEPEQEDAARSRDASFLEKPFAPDELARRVEEVLRNQG